MVSNAIKGYLDYIAGELSDFPIQNIFVFDTEMDFMKTGQQYISKQGIFEKIEGEIPQKWILLMWNRGAITPSGINGRPIRNITFENTNSNKFGGQARQISLNIDIGFICSDIELAEQLEERIVLYFPEVSIFEYNIPDYGTFKGNGHLSSNISFDKLPIQNTGSLTTVSYSANIEFQLFKTEISAKRIETIHSKIWDINGNII